MSSFTTNSILGLGLAAVLAHPASDHIDSRELLRLATAPIQYAQGLLGDDDAIAEQSAQKGPRIGLQMGTLASTRLQPAAGMGFAAGLTPIEEWRRIFPRKEQR
jgi:hypothetical protein